MTPEQEIELKAKQSKIGRSNVKRSKSQERRVAQLFTEWTGIEFRRRRVEGRDSNVIERESTADVIPVRGEAIFSIEVKIGKGFSYEALLANPSGSLLCKWWHQSCFDAQLMTKTFQRPFYPLLFFKPNPNCDMVAVSQKPFRTKELSLKSAIVPFPHLAFDFYEHFGEITHNVAHAKKKENEVLVPLRLDPIFFMRWQDLVLSVDPKSFFRAVGYGDNQS